MSFRRRFLVQALALAVIMAAAAEAKRHNREIDGFIDSGHYGLKVIVRRWMRESPGRYWIAYAVFVVGAILCLLFNLSHNTGPDPLNDPENIQGPLLALQSAILALCLMYVAVVVDTLSDLTVTYLVGLCEMQIMVDTIRVSVVAHNQKVMLYLALVPFAATSILSVVLQDSFGPLNQLNAAYLVAHVFIIHFAVRYTDVKRTKAISKKVMVGTLVSAAQMVFCYGAFYITWHVEGVPETVVFAFFFTTVMISGTLHLTLMRRLIKGVRL